MTSNDDILDVTSTQGRVVELRLSYSDRRRQLTELVDWPHKVCNFLRQLAAILEHGIFCGIVSCAENKLLN